MELGQILNQMMKNNQGLYLRYGVVSAVTTSPSRVSVKISGATTAVTGIRYLSTYTPLVNDVVLLLINDNDVVALGKLT